MKEEGVVQRPVYIVSKVLQGLEVEYSKIEKTTLTVMTTAQKIQLYFLSHLIKVRTNLPFRQTLGRPYLSRQMIKWAVELGEYEIEF